MREKEGERKKGRERERKCVREREIKRERRSEMQRRRPLPFHSSFNFFFKLKIKQNKKMSL